MAKVPWKVSCGACHSVSERQETRALVLFLFVCDPESQMLLMSLIFTVILSDLNDSDQDSYSEFTFLSHGISMRGDRKQDMVKQWKVVLMPRYTVARAIGM